MALASSRLPDCCAKAVDDSRTAADAAAKAQKWQGLRDKAEEKRKAAEAERKAQEELYAHIRDDGGAHHMVDRMQTRAELYAAIGYHDYEALDASIVQSVVPTGNPQRKG